MDPWNGYGSFEGYIIMINSIGLLDYLKLPPRRAFGQSSIILGPTDPVLAALRWPGKQCQDARRNQESVALHRSDSKTLL